MYNITTNVARTRSSPSVLNNVHIRYLKKVTSLDQMIPLYSCIPNFFGVDQLFCITYAKWSSLYPRVWGYLETLNPVLKQIVIKELQAWEPYVLRSNFLNNYKVEREMLHTYFSKLDVAVECSKTNLMASTSFDLVVKGATDRVAADLVELVPKNARTGVASDKPVDWYYGVYPFTNQTGNTGCLRDSLTKEQAFYLGTAPSGYCYQRYGFYGEFVSSHSVNDPSHSINTVLCGLKSAFCIMVKASKRFDIIIEALAGDLKNISWQKGEIELWEQKDIKSQLTNTDFNVYKENYYIPFRNQLKATVRIFDNLTEALFDVPQFVNGSPVKTAAEIKQVIDKAKDILNFDRMHHNYGNRGHVDFFRTYI